MALGVARVDDVMALRRAAVALALLGRKAALAQRHLVGADYFAPGQQFHHMVLLEDQNRVGLLQRCWLLGGQRSRGGAERKAKRGAHESENRTGMNSGRFHAPTLLRSALVRPRCCGSISMVHTSSMRRLAQRLVGGAGLGILLAGLASAATTGWTQSSRPAEASTHAAGWRNSDWQDHVAPTPGV